MNAPLRERKYGPHRITKRDPAGEVIFAAASTLTHRVFNGLPNMHRVYFRLRHQYQIWPRAGLWARSCDVLGLDDLCYRAVSATRGCIGQVSEPTSPGEHRAPVSR